MHGFHVPALLPPAPPYLILTSIVLTLIPLFPIVSSCEVSGYAVGRHGLLSWLLLLVVRRLVSGVGRWLVLSLALDEL
jgi:hypothetical protein